MQVYFGNPPWINGPHDVYHAWFRNVVRRTLLRSSRRLCIRPVADDLYQDTITKILLSREIEDKSSVLRYLEQHRKFVIRLIYDLSLFLEALKVIHHALSFGIGNIPYLVKLRDKVKSLNPPLSIIPQSLHPVASVAL
jgi:hypothetical protein